MTQKEVWERLAKMKGEFTNKCGRIRHKKRRRHGRCCPLACLMPPRQRSNDPDEIEAVLNLDSSFVTDFVTGADNSLDCLFSRHRTNRIRRRLLRVLGLKENS